MSIWRAGLKVGICRVCHEPARTPESFLCEAHIDDLYEVKRKLKNEDLKQLPTDVLLDHVGFDEIEANIRTDIPAEPWVEGLTRRKENLWKHRKSNKIGPVTDRLGYYNRHTKRYHIDRYDLEVPKNVWELLKNGWELEKYVDIDKPAYHLRCGKLRLVAFDE